MGAVVGIETAWDWAIILIALSAPTVILVLIAMLRGYNIKMWRAYRDDPDRKKEPRE